MIRPVGWDTAAVWLAEDGVPRCAPSGGWRHTRSKEHCRGESGSALSGGSSIVDEPGEF